MSCIVPIRELSVEQRDLFKRMGNDLKVVSKPPELKPWQMKLKFKPQVFYKKVEIQCYQELLYDRDNPRIVVPFAYARDKKLPIVPYMYPTLSTQKCTFLATLLDRQLEIEEEAMSILQMHKSILLSLYTGFGKSLFGLYLASQLRKKTIIVVHRSIIMSQWQEDIEKVLPNIKCKILSSKDTFNDVKDYDFILANVVNITEVDKNIFLSFGLVIIDEIHTMVTEAFSKSFFCLQPEYVIGLSATPERIDGLNQLIDLTVGKHTIVRKMHRIYNVYKIFTKIKPTITKKADGGMDWNSLLKSLSEHPLRNELIVKLIRFFSTRNILVVCKLVEHVRLLEQMCLEAEPDMQVSTFYGNKASYNKECRVLIASLSKSGVGFSFAKLDMLILAGDIKDNYQQVVGRIFRRSDTYPMVVDLVDSHATCRSHFEDQRKLVYTQSGGIIKDFDSTFPSFHELTDML